MKTYHIPTTNITECATSYMLMQNVSGGGLNGVSTDPLDNIIDIN